MASPRHIECLSCHRTHGPPTGAMCRYTKAAKEHCAQLGMMEEEYMLYLSDVSEEDPNNMTGGQLASLHPKVLSNPVQEHQCGKYVTNPETNQQEHMHTLLSQRGNNQDISHIQSDQKKRTEFKSKSTDKRYESIISSAPNTNILGEPLSSMEMKSPHAHGGKTSDMSEHEAADTEQHISDSEDGAQACITVYKRDEVCLVAAQDMQIRETDCEELHLSNISESECEISERITQNAGEQEEVVANDGTTQAEGNRVSSNLHYRHKFMKSMNLY